MDAVDRFAQEWGHCDGVDFVALFFGGAWQGVGDDESAQRALLNAFDGWVAEDSVGHGGGDLLGALSFEQGGDLYQSAGGVDLVINDQGVSAVDLANEVQDLRLIVVGDATRRVRAGR